MTRRRFTSLLAVPTFVLAPLLVAGSALAQDVPSGAPGDANNVAATPIAAPAPALDPAASPAAAPAADPSVVSDGTDKILPEVKFESVRLEDVIDFLQDVSAGKFRAVVVHRGNAEGPAVTMRLKNVSIGQVINVLTTAYGGIDVTPVDGPTGPVHVISISPLEAAAPAGGDPNAGAEADRAVRVYRLAGIVDTMIRHPGGWVREAPDPKQSKEALNNVLSLIKATVNLTNPREAPTLQVHEETQTLIFKGMPQQRQALEDVLSALESSKAVRPEKVSDQQRQLMNDAKAELERAKADAERARREAEVAREEASKRAQVAEVQLQDMNAKLRDREAVMARLEAELRSKAADAGGGSARDARGDPLAAEIDSVRAKLADVQQKYGADHPEVRNLKTQLERLEKLQAVEREKSSRPGTPGR